MSLKKFIFDYVIKPFIYSDIRTYYAFWKLIQLRDFYKNIKSDSPFLKTTDDSKEIYQQYNDREQIEYEHGANHCVFKKNIVEMTYFKMRQEYLKYLYQEIDKIITRKDHITVLEVGCGNCINLVNIEEKYGNKIQLSGLDISDKRIKVAQQYFPNKLANVNFYNHSITGKITEFEDDRFDIVFSMHCLEQIPYDCQNAVKEMYRLAKTSLIMIEPVFELGNPVQRLYLYNADHNRILLRTVRQLGYQVDRLEALDIQSNPLNQSSIIVVKKDHLT